MEKSEDYKKGYMDGYLAAMEEILKRISGDYESVILKPEIWVKPNPDENYPIGFNTKDKKKDD